MRADSNRAIAGDAGGSTVVERCSCGRIATARCWLGDNSPARWLFACRQQGSLSPDTPEAA